MQAVRGGSVKSVSWMALVVVVVVVLVYLPSQSTGFSVFKSEGGTEHKYLFVEDDFKNDYEEDDKNDYEKEDLLTDEVTTSTDEVTTSTDKVTTSTDKVTTSTDKVTTSTDKVTTSTDEVTTSTDEVTTSTDDITSSTDDNNISTDDTTTEKSTTTPLPSLSEQQVYEQTRDELSETETILDHFLSLVNEIPTTARSQDHPGVWWKSGMDQTQDIKNFDDICSDPDYQLCLDLQKNLNATEILVSKLGDDVDSWRQEDLQKLRNDNDILLDLYNQAKGDTNFKTSINTTNFKASITHMTEVVKDSLAGVEQKIDDMGQGNTDSVVLVAVMGSLGGLMVVGLVGVMIFGGVKRKGSKNPTSKPYNKLQGEHIPIDGFLSDGPEHRQAPRMDPYAPQMPPPSTSGDPYSAPYGVRSESDYSSRPVVTRVGQKLPRTHF